MKKFLAILGVILMTRRIRNMKDFVAALKMLPATLVVVGYAFLAAWVTGWLATNGYPIWFALCAWAAIMIFGFWQSYLFVMTWEKILRKINNPSGHENQRDNDKSD